MMKLQLYKKYWRAKRRRKLGDLIMKMKSRPERKD